MRRVRKALFSQFTSPLPPLPVLLPWYFDISRHTWWVNGWWSSTPAMRRCFPDPILAKGPFPSLASPSTDETGRPLLWIRLRVGGCSKDGRPSSWIDKTFFRRFFDSELIPRGTLTYQVSTHSPPFYPLPSESNDALMESEEPIQYPLMDDDDDDEFFSDAPSAPPPPEPQTLSRNDHQFVRKPQMSHRRFEKHLQWRKDLLGDEKRLDGGDEMTSVGEEMKKPMLPLTQQRQPPQDGLEADGEATTEDVMEPPFKRLKAEDDNELFDEPFQPIDPTSSDLRDSAAFELEDDFLIYEDTDSEEEDAEELNNESSFRQRMQRRKNWLFSQKEDPLPLKECLLLTYEEAFFLSFGLGCLTGEWFFLMLCWNSPH